MPFTEGSTIVRPGMGWWLSPLGLLVVAAALAATAAIGTIAIPTTNAAVRWQQVPLDIAFAGLAVFVALWMTAFRVDLTPNGVTCVGLFRRDELSWIGLPLLVPVSWPGGTYMLRGRRLDGVPDKAWLLTMAQARAIQRWPADHGLRT